VIADDYKNNTSVWSTNSDHVLSNSSATLAWLSDNGFTIELLADRYHRGYTLLNSMIYKLTIASALAIQQPLCGESEKQKTHDIPKSDVRTDLIVLRRSTEHQEAKENAFER
jgi:hypothetical protein